MKRNLSNKKWTKEIVASTSRKWKKFMKRFSNKKPNETNETMHKLNETEKSVQRNRTKPATAWRFSNETERVPLAGL